MRCNLDVATPWDSQNYYVYNSRSLPEPVCSRDSNKNRSNSVLNWSWKPSILILNYGVIVESFRVVLVKIP